jgi:hypothetical protein
MTEGGDWGWDEIRVWALMIGSSTGAATSNDAQPLEGPIQSLKGEGLIVCARSIAVSDV